VKRRLARPELCVCLAAVICGCGYDSQPADAGPGVDPSSLAETWSIDDTRFGSTDAFLSCRDAQAFDRDRDSVAGMTAGTRWAIGENVDLQVSTAARLADGEIEVTISRGAATFVAQSGVVSMTSPAAGEPWPVHLAFEGLPAEDATGNPALLTGDFSFDVSVCP